VQAAAVTKHPPDNLVIGPLVLTNAVYTEPETTLALSRTGS
jgi:hypothetical protein